MDAFLSNHLHGVSRTYALLVPMLPRALAEPVALAYLLMRIVDTLEDDPLLPTAVRLERLESLAASLGRGPCAGPDVSDVCGESPAETALMRDSAEVLRRIALLEPPLREPIHECAQAMIAGVTLLFRRAAVRDLPYPAIRDAGELREYCHYVAGVVGAMLCGMMAHYLQRPGLLRLRDLAIELGIGLQLVNILKDAMKDSRQGRRYLPRGERGSVAFAEIYRAVLGEARESLRRGADFVLALPPSARELRSFCGLPIAWGAMTLARADTNRAAAKIGRGAIRASIELFSRLAGDDLALRRWFEQMLTPPAATAVPRA